MNYSTEPGPQIIKSQLQRILSSSNFKASPRLKKFLQFVVERTLAGRANEVKGYTIATGVFGRKETFDQSTDPIVSVEARRLRRALEQYYLVTDMPDQVLITIPTGTFVPTFRYLSSPQASTQISGIQQDNYKTLEGWPTVLIRPFKNLSKDTHPNFIAEGFTAELAVELARHQDIRVMMKPSGSEGESITEPKARFIIEGNLRHGSNDLNVAVHLFDNKAESHIWGEVYRCNLDTVDLFNFQEEVAQVIAATVAEQEGFIVKTLSLESRNKPPADIETYEAIHKFYKFETTYSAETFFEALIALKQAISQEPECAQAWAYLGGLHVENYGLEMVDTETPIGMGIQYIEKAIQLAPSNQRFHLWMAEARLLNNQLPEGLAEAQKALNLNPDSLIYLDTIGYALALLGDWEQGCDLIKKALELNPYVRSYNHYILCWNWIRKKEYEKAYMETFNFRLPDLFWDPLNRAITLSLLGRAEEANQNIKKVLRLKPDFSARGQLLIRHFIKSEEMVECFIESLKKSGLDLE